MKEATTCSKVEPWPSLRKFIDIHVEQNQNMPFPLEKEVATTLALNQLLQIAGRMGGTSTIGNALNEALKNNSLEPLADVEPQEAKIQERMVEAKHFIPFLSWLPKVPCLSDVVEHSQLHAFKLVPVIERTVTPVCWLEETYDVEHEIPDVVAVRSVAALERLLLKIGHFAWHGHKNSKGWLQQVPEWNKKPNAPTDQWGRPQLPWEYSRQGGIFTDIFCSPTLQAEAEQSWIPALQEAGSLAEDYSLHLDFALLGDEHPARRAAFINQRPYGAGGATHMLRVLWPIDHVCCNDANGKPTQSAWVTAVVPQVLSVNFSTWVSKSRRC